MDPMGPMGYHRDQWFFVPSWEFFGGENLDQNPQIELPNWIL